MEKRAGFGLGLRERKKDSCCSCKKEKREKVLRKKKKKEMESGFQRESLLMVLRKYFS